MKFGTPAKVPKTAVQLYRDCLRAIRHTAARSEKSAAMRRLVRAEFQRNSGVVEPQALEKLRQNAFDGVHNYVLLHSLSQTKPELLAHAAQERMNVVEGMNPLQQGFLPGGEVQEAVRQLHQKRQQTLDSSKK